jgi:hypothetical protein
MAVDHAQPRVRSETTLPSGIDERSDVSADATPSLHHNTNKLMPH